MQLEVCLLMQAFAMKIEDNVNNHWRLYRKNYKISTQECKYILHLEKHLVTETLIIARSFCQKLSLAPCFFCELHLSQSGELQGNNVVILSS